MINVAKGKQIVVFLDYDGMLSPIVGDPECAFMTNQMRAAVDNVSNCFHTAIISGRSRKKVYDFVQLKGVFYSGSHGMDTMGPALRNTNNYDATFQKRSFDTEGNEFIIFQPAQHFLPEIKEMLTEVKERTENIPGVKIEDNMFCLSVHYRHVKDEDHERLENQVKSMLANHPDFHFTIGKKVFEIRPSIEWNKGDALNYLLEAFGFHNASKVFPIYIGDDKTDEDAFKVIRERGQGYPIIVSSKPRDTMALYSLKSPSEVQSFLTCLGRWGYDNGAITHHQ
ncbi:trehalose-phosphate phosphatase B-like [Bidens hawaiensis]|uniref:trehalose-phosphate phosphatase B-like n=1 Tax=Bidens hawaiensis TaxID=980011 RepID=UPI00404B84D0